MKKQKRFVLTDETVQNSYGFKVLTAGISLQRFLTNPVMLDTHTNQSKSVLGKWDDLKIEGGKITAVPVFDMDDPEAASVAGKVQRGFINGASVGILFAPEGLRIGNDDIPVIENCELVEASICAVPSNPNALQLFLKGNEGKPLTNADIKSLCLSAKPTKNKIINKLNMAVKKKAPVTPADNPDTELTLQEQLIEMLELDSAADDAAIVEAVQELVSQRDDTIEEQDQEAENLTNLAIQRGFLSPGLKNMQLMAFKQNFSAARTEMAKLFPSATPLSLSALVVNGGTVHNNGGNGSEKTDKPKSQWELDDYRKHAPHELAANPTLYKKLVDKKYNK